MFSSCFPSLIQLSLVVIMITSSIFYLCFLVSSAQIRCFEEDISLLLSVKNEISIDDDLHHSSLDSYHRFPDDEEVAPTPPKVWSWNSTENHKDCCLWEGVTCDSHSGHVIGLDLSSSFINGGINDSSSIFHLRHLQRLNLAYNKHMDFMHPGTPFTSGFTNMSSLTHLNLSNAGFGGPIPEHDISRLVKLVSLDLSWNMGSSVDMEKLVKNLTQLRVLYLDGIDLSQTINNISWSTVSNLRELSLRGCNFTGEALQLSSLLHLKSLTHLILSYNELAWNVSGYSFTLFPHLINLQLSNCKLFGRLSNGVFLNPNLQFIDVSSNLQLSGTLPHFPANNSSLQYINLEKTLFSGEIPDSMSYLVSLQQLLLNDCHFYGRFPSNVFFNPNLKYIDVSRNSHLYGTLPEFPMGGGNPLQFIGISDTKFSGKLPDSMHNLASLKGLDLANCMFHGVVPSSMDTLTELELLHFSGNNFSGPLPLLTSSHNITFLDFSSNNFSGNIPLSYGSSSQFQYLENMCLNNNNLQGQIPPSLFSLSSLYSLKLSWNQLEGQLEEFHNYSSYLLKIDLCHNKLRGHLPLSIFNISSLRYLSIASNDFNGRINLMDATNESSLFYLDLSDNHFQVHTGEPTLSSFKVLRLSSCSINLFPDFSRSSNLAYLDLSRNKIKENISPSICDLRSLEVMDLSANNLSGPIPPCLASLPSINVLSLRNNQLSGMLPDAFTPNCTLRTLDVNQNRLQSQLPESLGLCKGLTVIDVGKNNFKGKFPVWLENLPLLRVLILHSNHFSGAISSQNRSGFTSLQIFDISSNKFVGKLPSWWFTSWKEMMKHATPTSSHSEVIGFTYSDGQDYYDGPSSEFNYQDFIIVTDKGIETEYIKILTILILIDVSHNKFTGEIPEAISRLESLHLLNLSNNHFTGHIPVSLGQLRQLQSLDLSSNKLSGNIPTQLTELTFMSKLNLSHNSLIGEIPRGRQFETFGEESYAGNPGLCGLPLPQSCYKVKSPSISGKPNNAEAKRGNSVIDLEYYRVGIACGGGTGLIAGFVAAYLVFGNFFIQKRRVRRYAVRPLRT